MSHTRLLQGIRVLDMTNVLAGPFATELLALCGAEVIKIENPQGGDLARKLGNVNELNKQLMGTSFLAQNANKRSVTLNLKEPDAKEIFRRLKSLGVPRILFVNNVAPYLDIVADIDCEVIGVDYRCDLATASAALPHKSIQGNLDPAVLFSTPEVIRAEVGKILASYGYGSGHVFNLGHGILPNTPLEHVAALVAAVRAKP